LVLEVTQGGRAHPLVACGVVRRSLLLSPKGLCDARPLFKFRNSDLIEISCSVYGAGSSIKFPFRLGPIRATRLIEAANWALFLNLYRGSPCEGQRTGPTRGA
jgi:hypothetical protein